MINDLIGNYDDKYKFWTNNYNENRIVTKDEKNIYNIYTINDIGSINRVGEKDFLISDKYYHNFNHIRLDDNSSYKTLKSFSYDGDIISIETLVNDNYLINTTQNKYLYNSKVMDVETAGIGYIKKLNDDRFLISRHEIDYNVYDEIFYIMDSKSFETKALYSVLRHKVIPIFSEKRYENDPEYQKLSEHQKYKKRFNDTYVQKIEKYLEKVSEIKDAEQEKS